MTWSLINININKFLYIKAETSCESARRHAMWHSNVAFSFFFFFYLFLLSFFLTVT